MVKQNNLIRYNTETISTRRINSTCTFKFNVYICRTNLILYLSKIGIELGLVTSISTQPTLLGHGNSYHMLSLHPIYH